MPQSLYFGNAETQLFGTYHPPSGKPRGRAVLLCNPIGQEYVRSYRFYRQLANRLSAEGSHVFRFDYFGTGDSAGNSSDGSVSVWVENIGQAVEELKAMSAVKQIALIGLRFGATLAVLATRDRLDIDRLTLIDPVVIGRDYLDALQAIHRHMLVDSDRFPIARTNSESRNDELLGFVFTKQLASSIRDIDIQNLDIPALRRICIIDTEHRANLAGLIESGDGAGQSAEYLAIDSPLHWHDAGKIEIAFMPTDVIERVATEMFG